MPCQADTVFLCKQKTEKTVYGSFVMEKKSLLKISNEKKCYPLIVGFVVAIIHFIVTFTMNTLIENYVTESFLFLIFITPSVAFSLLSLSLNFNLSSLDNLSLFQLLFILFSSSVYGIIGGFLVSKRKLWRWAGTLMIGLLILSSCLIGVMWMATSW